MTKVLYRLYDVLNQIGMSVEDVEKIYNCGREMSAAKCLHYAREYRSAYHCYTYFDGHPIEERLRDYLYGGCRYSITTGKYTVIV